MYIDLKVKYTSGMMVFCEKMMSGKNNIVMLFEKQKRNLNFKWHLIPYINSKTIFFQLLLTDATCKFDDEYLYLTCLKSQVIFPVQHKIKDLFTWNRLSKISLMGGDMVSDPNLVVGEYEFNVERGLFKRFLSYLRWRGL